ncbi:hypothetical protein AN640_03315 [Candidatus Epulonipiscium fishelsonii]|uniref:Uncharacterized protein n=1 Tax=Candidatus Epulonipiscium fishelsonii TaxID=77094 RepID=A0ACC8XJH2_9FIRM|nr:hypothetical protein AN640_03315 [Epulopiscium sp. SCG-D08WGA-EpuloA1]
MSFFDGMNIAATGLTAQRQRLDIITQNLANVDTTRTPEGGPYQRKVITFEQMNPGLEFNSVLNETMGITQKGVKGVRVASIVEDNSPFQFNTFFFGFQQHFTFLCFRCFYSTIYYLPRFFFRNP